MKIKTGICIIMALLMTISTFSIISANPDDCEHPGEVVVEKKVWDKEENRWADKVEAEIGEILKFKIELTYHMDEFYNDNPLVLYDINITDDFSDAYCFEYVEGSSTTTPTEIIENEGLYWELDTELNDNDSLNIEFELLIVKVNCEETTNLNWVSVRANECGIYEHYVGDYITINLKAGLKVEKKVWYNNEWAEELPYVKRCENVKFQIKTTYYGMINMKCGLVADLLPDECLDYIKTTSVKIAGVTYSPGDKEYPVIKAEADDTITICNDTYDLSDLVNTFGDHIVIWDWRNDNLFLENGQSIIIEFEANVTKYCCQETYKNWAFSFLYGCYLCDECNYVSGYNSANISCCPPPTTFEKQVSKDNGETWEEEVDVTADSTVKFNLKFTYYGNEEYDDVRIKDALPCILEYVEGSANIQPTNNLSDDKKIIWWNLTDTLKDCDVITITFDALVTGTTGCDCKAINNAWIYLYEEQDCQDVIVAEYHDTASITSGCNCYPHADIIEAPTNGATGEDLTFKVKGYDQHGDNIKFGFDWNGDKIVDEWTSYHPENTIVSQIHSWETEGIYDVRVKAKDIHGAEGPWSEPAESVNITPAAPVIEIGFKGGFNKITMIITNNKDESLNESYYNLTVTAGLLFSKTNQYNDTVNLSIGANNIVLPWKSILGKIGSVNINGTILLPGYTDPYKIEGSGFVIGRFFIFM